MIVRVSLPRAVCSVTVSPTRCPVTARAIGAELELAVSLNLAGKLFGGSLKTAKARPLL